MKKICSIIFIAGMLSSGLFAEEKIKFLSAHFSVPIGIEDVAQGGVEQSTVMTSIGLGIDGLTLFSDKVGLYVNLDFFLPLRISITQRYQDKIASAVVTPRNFESLLGISYLCGPSFVVSRSEKMLFTISPGLHSTILYFKSSSDASFLVQYGLGVNFQDQMFFSSKGFFLFGADVVYDFYIMGSGRTNYWAIKPSLGLGFSF